MREELFIQFGHDDRPSGGTLADPGSTSILNMMTESGGLSHGLDQLLAQLHRLNIAPSEIALDLLIVAASVYIADTSVSRSSYEDGWTRRITIHLPVSDMEAWQAASDQLGKMLRFLTGDYWSIRFRGRPEKFQKLIKNPDGLNLTDFDNVSLFSGGLDSLIGAIDLIATGRKPLLIGHYWDGETSSAQNILQGELVRAFGKDAFRYLRARIGVERSDLESAGSENSQRPRSFLFYSMAAMVADALGLTDNILIPENGLIALNVPMDPLRIGSLTTRTAHPHFIASMEELASMVGMSSKFENPYRFKTKGEMVAECHNPELLKRIASKSMSCSSPAKVRWKGASPQHCGHCLPCLIRRASLQRGLIGKDTTEYYLDDLKAKTLDSKGAEGKDIRSLLYAVDTSTRNPAKIPYLVRKPGPLPSSELQDYVDVYTRGMNEVRAFLEGVKSEHR